MNRQQMLNKAKKIVRDRTPTKDTVHDHQDVEEYCEFCCAYPDCEPEETIYIQGQYLQIGEHCCEDCKADIESEVARLEEVANTEKIIYLENYL